MANTNDVYWLVSGSSEVALGESQRFWKELIREGRWVNAGAGFTLQVSRDRLKAWKQHFDEMCAAGIKVPVPWGHSYDPRDNAGFVHELELRDGSLWGLLDVPNPKDAAKLGTTVSGVSVSINPNFVDGSGRVFGEAIEHVALTNYPVVAGQGGFIQAAGGGTDKRAIALELADEKAEPDWKVLAGQLRIELENVRAEIIELRAMHLENADDPETRKQNKPQMNADSETDTLYQLERERAERDADEAMRLGKFTKPAADALRRLLTAGIATRLELDTAGTDAAQLARDIIANTPPGAAVDTTEHTKRYPMPNPSGRSMTEARAAELARENKTLAGI